jgi:hypothetical protein
MSNDAPYFEAIGRFIVEYAAAEGAMHLIARKYSGMGEDKARIVFSGMRLGDITERIRGILKTDKIEDGFQIEIDKCITQLDLISSERNKIVHRYTSYDKDHISVTNVMTAKSVASSERHIFRIEDLRNMTGDCSRIYLRMLIIVDNLMHHFATAGAAIAVYGPWQYIPARPTPKPKPPREVPQSRKRQPPASRE